MFLTKLKRQARTASWCRRALWLFMGGWTLLMLTVGATLMAGHWSTLPVPPSARPEVVAGLARLRTPADQGRWQVVHVLYAECRCSRRILEHLASRKALPGLSEVVLLVSGDRVGGARPAPPPPGVAGPLHTVSQRGFRMVRTTPADLERLYGFEAAPLLLVGDTAGTVRYLGGYTDRKQGPDIRDVGIVRNLIDARSAPALPLFGCAASERLQQWLDPLRAKYRTRT